MSGRISIVIALVMVFVAVMLSCSKKTLAQETPQTPKMYMEFEISEFGFRVMKYRDPADGTVCYIYSGKGISCLR
jgi:hypothetical protein